MTFRLTARRGADRVEVVWTDGKLSGDPALVAAANAVADGRRFRVYGYGEQEARLSDPLAACQFLYHELTREPDLEDVEVEGDVPEMEAGDVTEAPRTALREEAAAARTGAMVALYPPPELATELALDRGDAEEPADIHLTLAFLGNVSELPPSSRALRAVKRWAESTEPFSGVISGTGLFVGGPKPVTYFSVDLPALPAARERLVRLLTGAGVPPRADHGFTPHMTLAYEVRRPRLEKPVPLRFERVTLAWAEEQISVPLGRRLREGELEEREIWIKPYDRDGEKVAGYWRFVDALQALADPRNPVSQVNLGDGRRIRHDAAPQTPRDSYIIEHPDEGARRIQGADAVARDLAIAPPEIPERAPAPPELAPEELDALRRYVEPAGDYPQLNPVLRSGGTLEGPAGERIKHMESALKKASPLPRGTKLYRGLDLSATPELADSGQITDAAFLSTSTDPGQALAAATSTGGERPALLRLTTREGVKGLDIQQIFPDEEELSTETLLERGMKVVATGPPKTETVEGEEVEVVDADVVKMTPADVARAAVAANARETFAERAAHAKEVWSGEPDSDSQAIYGIPPEQKGEDWIVTDVERAEFHRDWAEAVNAGVPIPPGKPKAILMVGGGGSGKGTLQKSGKMEELPPDGEYAVNDPDEAKVATPEFQLLAGKDVPREERWEDASARIHEQSGTMNDLSTALSRESGVDFIYDKVGGSGSWFRFAEELKAADTHDLTIHVATVPTQTAIDRAKARGERSGRFVHEDAMREAHARVSATFDQVAELGIPTKVWNMEGEEPVLIAEVTPDGKLVTHAADLYKEFRAKAEENVEKA